MTIQAFADSHRLKTKRDECLETIIPGRFGQIYEYGPDLMGVMCMFKSARKWGSIRRRLQAHGFQIRQDGDWEGSAIFDPENAEQIKVACSAIKCRPRRKASEKQLETISKMLAARGIVRTLSTEARTG